MDSDIHYYLYGFWLKIPFENHDSFQEDEESREYPDDEEEFDEIQEKIMELANKSHLGTFISCVPNGENIVFGFDIPPGEQISDEMKRKIKTVMLKAQALVSLLKAKYFVKGKQLTHGFDIDEGYRVGMRL